MGHQILIANRYPARLRVRYKKVSTTECVYFETTGNQRRIGEAKHGVPESPRGFGRSCSR